MSSRAAALLELAAPAFPAGRFVVALSGGADSCVLAWLSAQLPDPTEPRAVFVHHGWAGSDRMQEAATAVAARVGLPLEVVRVATTTTEGEARRLRLAALEQAAQGDRIVTAHNADDVAETIILNMGRGAGATGRTGIPAERGSFVRPLLDIAAAELRAVATELALPFADDPANVSAAHPRNVVRHEVIPRLEEVVPGARRGLVRSAQLAAADDAALDARAMAIALRVEPGAVSFPAAAVAALPTAVVSRVVRRALRMLRPPYAGDRGQIAEVLAAAGGTPCDLGGGLRVEREGPYLTVIDTSIAAPPPPPVALPVPGRVEFARHRLDARLASPTRVGVRGRHVAVLDVELAGALIARTAEVGERIDIGTGHKLVSDALSEAGIARRLRPAWPVLVARGKIAWIPSVRQAPWAGPQPEARQVLQLTTETLGCSTT